MLIWRAPPMLAADWSKMRINAYVPSESREGLRQRLVGLLDGGFPTQCRVYVSLGVPGPGSSHHARATYLLASQLDEGTVDARRFNSKPSPRWRLFEAASLGQPNAIASDMSVLAAEFQSPLWARVAAATSPSAGVADRTAVWKSAASELMLRLGYPSRAKFLTGLADIKGDESFEAIERLIVDEDMALAQYHVLSRIFDSSERFAEFAVNQAQRSNLNAETRVALLKAFVVAQGRKRQDDPRLSAVFSQAVELSEEVEGEFYRKLLCQTVKRAGSFIPFLKGEIRAALDMLSDADEDQRSAVPTTSFERLMWQEHAFPLYETLEKTSELGLGHRSALPYAEEMVALSAGDARAWLTRGRLLAADGDLEGAMRDFSSAAMLGGQFAVSAVVYSAVLHHELGNRAAAQRSREDALRLDPSGAARAFAQYDGIEE